MVFNFFYKMFTDTQITYTFDNMFTDIIKYVQISRWVLILILKIMIPYIRVPVYLLVRDPLHQLIPWYVDTHPTKLHEGSLTCSSGVQQFSERRGWLILEFNRQSFLFFMRLSATDHEVPFWNKWKKSRRDVLNKQEQTERKSTCSTNPVQRFFFGFIILLRSDEKNFERMFGKRFAIEENWSEWNCWSINNSTYHGAAITEMCIKQEKLPIQSQISWNDPKITSTASTSPLPHTQQCWHFLRTMSTCFLSNNVKVARPCNI